MSTKNLKEFESSIKSKSLYGLYLKEGEKNKLYELCIKYKIEIHYTNLFTDDTHYSLWGISKNGIGLIGTVIMNYLSENNGVIFESLDQFETYLREEEIK